jgi:hypothetical protein
MYTSGANVKVELYIWTLESLHGQADHSMSMTLICKEPDNRETRADGKDASAAPAGLSSGCQLPIVSSLNTEASGPCHPGVSRKEKRKYLLPI